MSIKTILFFLSCNPLKKAVVHSKMEYLFYFPDFLYLIIKYNGVIFSGIMKKYQEK